MYLTLSMFKSCNIILPWPWGYLTSHGFPFDQVAASGLLQQVRYQVTPEGVQQIFAEKPHVHRAFMANVPAVMDENAFWTRFFKNELNRQVSATVLLHIFEQHYGF